VAIFGAVPAMNDLNFALAPGWVQVVLLLTAAHLIYVLWLISIPDWSTLWLVCSGARPRRLVRRRHGRCAVHATKSPCF